MRMVTMGYGARLRAALPPMTAVATEAEALAWLAELARAHDGARPAVKPAVSDW
jgi:hypothetical protein